MQWYNPDQKNERSGFVLVLLWGTFRPILDDVVLDYWKKIWPVFSYDNIGHGKSGKTCHCPNYSSLLALDNVIAKARSISITNLSFFTVIVCGWEFCFEPCLSIKSILAGNCSHSYIKLAFQPPKWKMAFGKAMLNYFLPFPCPLV